jgi:hypothetical protein
MKKKIFCIQMSQGSCEHGNEPSGSIKCSEFLEWLHSWQLLKRGSAHEFMFNVTVLHQQQIVGANLEIKMLEAVLSGRDYTVPGILK